MPIKNYTTEVPASRSINAIQDALVKHGATGIQYQYEQGTGRIEAVKFQLPINDTLINFSLPVSWRRFQRVLEKQRVSKWKNEDYVYRVAWRNIHDWVMAQLAFYETEIVDMGQVFLPFVTDKNGQTLYEHVQANPRFLLGDGQ
jgi:hypothetical protein